MSNFREVKGRFVLIAFSTKKTNDCINFIESHLEDNPTIITSSITHEKHFFSKERFLYNGEVLWEVGGGIARLYDKNGRSTEYQINNDGTFNNIETFENILAERIQHIDERIERENEAFMEMQNREIAKTQACLDEFNDILANRKGKQEPSFSKNDLDDIGISVSEGEYYSEEDISEGKGHDITNDKKYKPVVDKILAGQVEELTEEEEELYEDALMEILGKEAEEETLTKREKTLLKLHFDKEHSNPSMEKSSVEIDQNSKEEVKTPRIKKQPKSFAKRRETEKKTKKTHYK